MSRANEEEQKLAIENDLDIPDGFECPITCQIMSDPVITAFGRSYERAAIEQWLRGGRHSDSMSGAPLPHRHLIPNIDLKKAIDRWVTKRPVIQRKAMEAADLQLAIQLREEALKTVIAKQDAQLREAQSSNNALNQKLQTTEQALQQQLIDQLGEADEKENADALRIGSYSAAFIHHFRLLSDNEKKLNSLQKHSASNVIALACFSHQIKKILKTSFVSQQLVSTKNQLDKIEATLKEQEETYGAKKSRLPRSRKRFKTAPGTTAFRIRGALQGG